MQTLSKFDICSAALLSFGARRIASFDETTAEGIVAAGLYDTVVDGEFGRHRWNFARAWFRLNRIAGADHGRFLYAYQLPSDCILLRAIKDAHNDPVDYETMRGRLIGTSDENPIAFYTARIPETQWPAYFVDLITQRLAAFFAGGLRKDPVLRDRMMQRIESTAPPIGAFAMAKKLDEQEQTAPVLPKGPAARAWGPTGTPSRLGGLAGRR